MIMTDDLYYCKPWGRKHYNCYSVCVSDLVVMNSLIQIHCAAFICQKEGGLCIVRGYATKDLEVFEENVRKHVWSFIDSIGTDDYCDSHTVKMWYYNPDDREFDTSDIPMRIAITFYKPTELNDNEKKVSELKELIYTEMYKLLDKKGVRNKSR